MKQKKTEVVQEASMSQAELTELLAPFQHASWSRWISFIFDQCQRQRDGSMTIPTGLVVKWMKEAETSYAELLETRKQLYRDEVAYMLPVIEKYKG